MDRKAHFREEEENTKKERGKKTADKISRINKKSTRCWLMVFEAHHSKRNRNMMNFNFTIITWLSKNFGVQKLI
jgi:hypothetical protein